MNNKIFDKMREAHGRQMKQIKKLPGYEKESKDFDIEYAIAQELYKVRKHAQFSQKELARKLHTTQSVISRMESGVANLTVEKLNDYANACGGRLKVKIDF